jgi:hypothetical protein
MAASERSAQVSKRCRGLVRISAIKSCRFVAQDRHRFFKARAESRYERASWLMSMETISI